MSTSRRGARKRKRADKRSKAPARSQKRTVRKAAAELGEEAAQLHEALSEAESHEDSEHAELEEGLGSNEAAGAADDSDGERDRENWTLEDAELEEGSEFNEAAGSADDSDGERAREDSLAIDELTPDTQDDAEIDAHGAIDRGGAEAAVSGSAADDLDDGQVACGERSEVVAAADGGDEPEGDRAGRLAEDGPREGEEPPADPTDEGAVSTPPDEEEALVDGIPRELIDSPEEGEGELLGEDSPERPGLEKTKPQSVGQAHLKSVLESLIFVSDKPVPAQRLARVARARTKDVVRLLGELVEEYRGRGIELVELAGGYQFRSAAVNAPFVREILETKPVRLTRAQLETLAICAYRQPLTRPEIEEIRGVDSGSALKVLLERGLVKILGRKDEAGRPLLYGTTPLFLEFFGMRSLDELPTLREFSELSDESRALFARKTGEDIGSIGEISVPEGEWQSEDDEDEDEEGGDAESSEAATDVPRGGDEDEDDADADLNGDDDELDGDELDGDEPDDDEPDDDDE